jgi:DNA-binding NtrC family response regulator
MARKQIRVLVVDDEETVRNLLKRTLEEAGYDVVTAANGEEALHEVSQQEPEAVLLDIKMPGLSGIDVLAKITTDWSDICVMMVTAVGDTQTAVEAMKLGAYDYITKPFKPNDVVRKVQEAINKRESLLQRKHLSLELQQSLAEKSEQMREQFNDLVRTLAREHTLLYKLTMQQPGSAKSALSKLPPELREPMTSVEEFREALLKILKREKL